MVRNRESHANAELSLARVRLVERCDGLYAVTYLRGSRGRLSDGRSVVPLKISDIEGDSIPKR